jgi:hypothetical protein
MNKYTSVHCKYTFPILFVYCCRFVTFPIFESIVHEGHGVGGEMDNVLVQAERCFSPLALRNRSYELFQVHKVNEP